MEEKEQKPKIVFMGTPDFAVLSLQALIDSEAADVVGVVTQPDRPAGRGNHLKPPPVKVAAEAAAIPVFQPKSLKKFESAQQIRDWAPDLIVVTAFGQILRPHVLDLPRLGCINVHASLLPRWRGAAPIQAAILHGDEQTGVTLMQMDVGLDTGDMLFVEAFDLDPAETASTLHDKLAQQGYDMLLKHLPAILEGEITPQKQDDALATYAPKIEKTDGQINWSRSAVEIERRHRAMTPWPGSFTSWNGKNLRIHKVSMVGVEGVGTTASLRNQIGSDPFAPYGEPGTVVKTGEGIGVATGDGVLTLDIIQLEGKKRTSPADFINGRPDFIGSRLS
ncbi:MAG: methionyl-tRNA formyltransferase [Cellvibrionaceae bacterium]|jgi:methionyl-tRNA formyltransferase